MSPVRSRPPTTTDAGIPGRQPGALADHSARMDPFCCRTST